MKDTISKNAIRIIREFEQEIIRAWNDLSIELVETLFNSMKRRIDSLIEAKDDLHHTTIKSLKHQIYLIISLI